MTEICGIIADIKREAQGVYIFPRLTLLGFNKQDPLVQRLEQRGLNLEDDNKRYEGLEIRHKSPFCLMRILAEEFGYKIIKMVPSDAPGDRSGLMWTMVVEEEEGKKGVESVGIVADIQREGEGEYVIPVSTVFGLKPEELTQLVQTEGLKVHDCDRRNEGVEIHGASPFMIMRVLCGKYGWSCSDSVENINIAEGKSVVMWTLNKQL